MMTMLNLMFGDLLCHNDGRIGVVISFAEIHHIPIVKMLCGDEILDFEMRTVWKFWNPLITQEKTKRC